MKRREYTVLHLFCGIGGGGLGSAEARAQLDGHEAKFRVMGGVDLDAQACQDFERLVKAPALRGDIAKMQPSHLVEKFGTRSPDFVLLSSPCKAFSGLLSKKLSETKKYQDMAMLTVEGIHLVLSTWATNPRVIFMENVPRITSRGAHLLDTIRQTLAAHGYAVSEGYHDCGELGGLGQRRRRFFLIARNRSRMSQFVYVPPKQRVKACGEVLGELPMPGLSGDAGGLMHTMPKLSMLNLLRLASIPAGGDWRDLPGVVPIGGKRREVHRRHMVVNWQEPGPTIGGSGSNGASAVADPRGYSGYLGVLDPREPAGTVTAGAAVARGAFAVADGRPLALGATAAGASKYKGSPGLFGVLDWSNPSHAVTGNTKVIGSNTPAAVADPRCGQYHNNYRVLEWQEPANTVAGATRPGNGAASISAPRAFKGGYGVLEWTGPSGAVSGEAYPSTGLYSIDDPRALNCRPRAGAYGLLSWDEAAALISGNLRVDNGRAAVADPRVRDALAMVPADWKRPPQGLLVVIAADGTWHRPLTTLELAALQGFPTWVAGEPLVLAGRSHTRWRQAIGDAIPPPAARAVSEQILEAMLASDIEQYRLRAEPMWVGPLEEGAVVV